MFRIKTRSGNVVDRRSDDPVRAAIMHGLSREGVRERIMKNYQKDKKQKEFEATLDGQGNLPKGMSYTGQRYIRPRKGDFAGKKDRER